MKNNHESFIKPLKNYTPFGRAILNLHWYKLQLSE
jgi:hypothetical protein